MTRPANFPEKLWPLPKGIRIVSVLEMNPPIFKLSSGDEIQGIPLSRKVHSIVKLKYMNNSNSKKSSKKSSKKTMRKSSKKSSKKSRRK